MSASLSHTCPMIMGIINVTPDSFSGDGVMQHVDYIATAVDQAMQMIRDGADILDIGGESSRPGFTPVSVDEEIIRVVPVIRALRQRNVQCVIAVDTIKAAVADAALNAGAEMINDISALAHDPNMAAVIARHKARVVLMHNRGTTDAVTHDPRLGGEYQASIYDDIVGDVVRDLQSRVDVAQGAGINPDKIILDPGIGFGKSVAQNLQLIDQLNQIATLGFPVLLGVSRKGFIGRVLDAPVDDRLAGTAACVSAGVMRGAAILRVHDVAFMAAVVKMTHAIMNGVDTQ